MIENNIEGINPTAEFIARQHTGKFVNILPGTYIIKGAKNEQGFDQGYALSPSNKKELLLIDVVDEATREAVKTIISNGYSVKGIIISGQTVLQDAFADLESLSANAGDAPIYLHSSITTQDNFKTRPLDNNDSLLKSYDLEIQPVPGNTKGMVLIYSSRNQGMLFVGDAVYGAEYKSDIFTFSRQKEDKQNDEFETAKFWQSYRKEFNYFFPRRGKPAIEVDARTRTSLLDRVSRGKSN